MSGIGRRRFLAGGPASLFAVGFSRWGLAAESLVRRESVPAETDQCHESQGPPNVCDADGQPVAGTSDRWSPQQAWRWYNRIGPIRGVNYLPAYCVNTLELWQAETFRPREIERELGWAAEVGLNSLRLFLHNLVWEADAESANARLDAFLTIAWRHGLRTLIVLFDDCWNQSPKLGPQPDPVPGVHNSRWVASPGRDRVVDASTWSGLEKYVRSVVGAFGRDERVLGWDVYNEPGNSGRGAKSLPLLRAAFSWVRAEKPVQPLTVGLWANFADEMHREFAELSDVISFHCYGGPAEFRARLETVLGFGRPVLCTEFLRRQTGNTFVNLLPLMDAHRVGWYFWGLVAGRSQTYYDWGSKPGDPPPAIWQHDLLHPDGKPFDPEEVALLREYARRDWRVNQK